MRKIEEAMCDAIASGREWVEHDLYSLSIGEWESDDDE